jgi:hypothetical protein
MKEKAIAPVLLQLCFVTSSLAMQPSYRPILLRRDREAVGDEDGRGAGGDREDVRRYRRDGTRTRMPATTIRLQQSLKLN